MFIAIPLGVWVPSPSAPMVCCCCNGGVWLVRKAILDRQQETISKLCLLLLAASGPLVLMSNPSITFLPTSQKHKTPDLSGSFQCSAACLPPLLLFPLSADVSHTTGTVFHSCLCKVKAAGSAFRARIQSQQMSSFSRLLCQTSVSHADVNDTSFLMRFIPHHRALAVPTIGQCNDAVAAGHDRRGGRAGRRAAHFKSSQLPSSTSEPWKHNERAN